LYRIAAFVSSAWGSLNTAQKDFTQEQDMRESKLIAFFCIFSFDQATLKLPLEIKFMVHLLRGAVNNWLGLFASSSSSSFSSSYLLLLLYDP
jgi:hypothetical protein